MTGNNKFWRASLAGLASVAMLATMGVAASTANAAGIAPGDGFTDNKTFAVKVVPADNPTELLTTSATAKTYGNLITENDLVDPYALVGDGKVLAGYSYDRAGEKPVTFPFAITGDTKLYAQPAAAVKVTFDTSTVTSGAAENVPTLNDVDGSLAGKPGEIDIPTGTALTADEYEKAVSEKDTAGANDSFSFVGWTTTKDNAQVQDNLYTDAVINKPTTLYARYDRGQNKALVKFSKAGNDTPKHLRATVADTAYPEFRAPSDVKQTNFKEFQVNGKKYDFTQKVANINDDPAQPDLSIVAAAYSADESVDVSFEFNTSNTTHVSGVTATAKGYTTSADETVAKPADPAKAGAYFTGWYTDEGLKTPFDFSKAIKDQSEYVAGTHKITLYAGWDNSNIARRVYNLHYAFWDEAQAVQYVDARGKVAVLSGLEDYTSANNGSTNARKLTSWKTDDGTDVALDQVPDQKDKETLFLNANWKGVVAVLLNADGGFFSNNSHYKWVLADEGTKLADVEGYEVPTKAGFTFKYWVDHNGNQFNSQQGVYDGLAVTADYEATGILSVESLHETPYVPAGNKEFAYDQYKTNGYTEASWKAYVDTWYQLQDEWDAYYWWAGSHQDKIDAGNALAKKYADAQKLLVKSDVPVKPEVSRVAVWRAYNPNQTKGSAHLYTTDEAEYKHAVDAGWRAEGVVFYTTPSDAKDLAPVYRLYNTYDGSHHYTTDKNEKDFLVKAGWTDEGVAWTVAADADADVYRAYNPYTGEHLFTTAKAEADNAVNAGWTDEGVAFKAFTEAK